MQKKCQFSKMITVIGVLLCLTPGVSAHPNWAEALQKSLYFFDANMCGPVGTEGASLLNWRGDCHLEDKRAVNPTNPGQFLDVSGGFHDSADHVKFNLPQGYAAATLGWSYYEFKPAFAITSQESHMINILKWFSDYLLKCTILDTNNNLILLVTETGSANIDHTYWGPPETQDQARPIRVAGAGIENATAIAATCSAALALMSINYNTIDPVYADLCLTKSIALYHFAKENYGAQENLYYPPGNLDDDLAWAAVWLYEKTGEIQYIRDIDNVDGAGNYTGYFKIIMNKNTNLWKNKWTYCWETVWTGVFVKLSHLFPTEPRYKLIARWNLEYLSGGIIPHQDPEDTEYLPPTNEGYAILSGWSSSHNNTASQLCALVYQKYHPAETGFTDWARGQMEYLLGANSMHYSYLIGYPSYEKSAKYPFHRAAHGSTTNSPADPPYHKHILWGGLVGGPDGENDWHIDNIYDYVVNSVSITGNASCVAALAGHYLLYGAGTIPIRDFPPDDFEPEDIPKYETGNLNFEQSNSTQWFKVNLTKTYNEPVVIMGPPSSDGVDPCTIRVKNVTSRSFEYQLDEWHYLDGSHSRVTVSYMVIEAGVYTLQNAIWEARRINDVNHLWKSAGLVNTGGRKDHVILAQTVTVASSYPVTTRLTNVTMDGFRIRLQEEEGEDGVHAKEEVHCLTVTSYDEVFSIKDKSFYAYRISGVNNNYSTVNFDTINNPVILAQIGTYSGRDTASLRYRNLSTQSVDLRCQEEQSADEETSHTGETIHFLILEQ